MHTDGTFLKRTMMTEADFVETRRVLDEYGQETVLTMQNILIAAGKDATGTLINSISYEILYDGAMLTLEFDMADYGIYVDQGRRPGKMPPISNIADWCRVKGIPQTAAFPIARKIGKEGIPATPFFSSTVESTRDTLVQELAIAGAKDVQLYLEKKIAKLTVR